MRPKSPNYYQKNIMVKRILLSIVLLLVIAYLVVAVTAFNRKPTSQVCQDVELVIKDTVYAGFITKKEVATLLEKKGISPIGKDLERVRTKTLERELAKHPLIDQVECYKTPSGKLCIEVTQRTPILRVMSANGENYYLDNKGTVMPPDAKCVVHLAVVDGEVAPVVTDEGLRAALQIDDRQTAEGEIRASLAVGAVKVGAAVTNRVRHRGRICLSGPADAVFVIDSDESAHKGKSFPMMGLGLGAYSPVPVTSL